MFIKQKIINCIEWEKQNKCILKIELITITTTYLKDFESGLLKIYKKHYKEINIYYIGYIRIKKNDVYESIYSVNPL